MLSTCRFRASPRGDGFTLIELMVALAVLAVLLTLGSGHLGAIWQRNATAAGGNALLGSLQYARQLAVLQEVPVVVCAKAADSLACDEQAQVWRRTLTFADRNGDGRLNGGERAERVDDPPRGVTYQADSRSITIFNTLGSTLAGDHRVFVCLGDAYETVVFVEATGRSSVQRASGACD